MKTSFKDKMFESHLWILCHDGRFDVFVGGDSTFGRGRRFGLCRRVFRVPSVGDRVQGRAQIDLAAGRAVNNRNLRLGLILWTGPVG